ncbi:MAG: VCBS repeat-containing protein [Nitrospiria bacterium]
MPIGGRTQFTLSPAQAASWSVNSVNGGNDTVGRISLIGGYTAPFVIPSASTAVPTGPDPTVLIAANVASNTATVTLVRRFIDDGAVHVCPSLPPTACVPSAVIAPDLNADGFTDLVTANAGNGTISVVLRNGPSSFYDGVESPLGTSPTAEPQALVAGLFDGNQSLDLVIADADSNSPAVWMRTGVGNGTFPSEQSVGLLPGSRPLSMGAGRFDNDSIRDVVVTDFANDQMTILFGDPGGGFLAPAPKALAANALPLGVAVADFDNDTFDDIAVANNGTDTIAVFLAVGDGTFSSEQTYAVAGSPSAIVAADLNLDGFPDLAVTTISGGLVLIINKGTPFDPSPETFRPPALTTYPTGAGPVAVAAGDINQDQFADLVIVNKVDETLVVYLGHGDGTLTVSETYAVGMLPLSVAVGDFNGDTWPDLAVANSGDDTVTILRNRGPAATP